MKPLSDDAPEPRVKSSAEVELEFYLNNAKNKLMQGGAGMDPLERAEVEETLASLEAPRDDADDSPWGSPVPVEPPTPPSLPATDHKELE